MATYVIYKLHPRSRDIAFHFGERGVGLENTIETFPSDSLFSAWCMALRELEGIDALVDLLLEFQGNDPPFLITSTFPFAGDALFLPRPQMRPPSSFPEDRYKEFSQVRWVSIGVLNAYLQGGDSFQRAIEQGRLLQSDSLWALNSEVGGFPGGNQPNSRFWTTSTVPRVTVDRVGSSSEIYHCKRVHFAGECGLYFLMRWRRSEARLRQSMEGALRCLGDMGIGGERSSGHGQFIVETQENDLPLEPFNGQGQFLNLALYCPSKDELSAGVLGSPAAYSLVKRYGWMSSPGARGIRRQSVYMLSEGSLLNGLGASAYGRLVDVSPPKALFDAHQVYRYGYAFPIGRPEEGDGD